MDFKDLDLSYDKRHAVLVLETLDRCGRADTPEDDNLARQLARDASVLMAKLVAIEAMANEISRAMENTIGRMLKAYETHGSEAAEETYCSVRDTYDRSVTGQVNSGLLKEVPRL